MAAHDDKALPAHVQKKRLTGKPLIHETAIVRGSQLGKFTKVGARTTIIETEMGAYSYAVNDCEIVYATIGKFVSIGPARRPQPSEPPAAPGRAGAFHLSLLAIFRGCRGRGRPARRPPPGARQHRPRRLDRPRGHRPARSLRRHRRGDRRRRRGDQGRRPLHDRRRQPGPRHPAALSRSRRQPLAGLSVVGLAAHTAPRRARRFPRSAGRGVPGEIRSRRGAIAFPPALSLVALASIK